MSALHRAWAAFAFAVVAVTVAFAPHLMAADVQSELAAVAARIEQPELLRGQFEQRKQIAGFRKPLRSRGHFLLSRGQGVIWRTEQPFPSQLTVTAQRLRATTGDRVREIDAATEPALRAINRVLFELLAGDLDGLQQGFEITVLRADAGGWHLQLSPRTGMFAQVFAAVELEGDRHVGRVVLVEVNGDRSDIDFTAMTTSPPMDATERAELAD